MRASILAALILTVHFTAVGQGSVKPASRAAFEGRIHATLTRGGEAQGLRYTMGTNFLRVEMTASDRPNPVDIVDLKSGELTLLYPHNRSFVRLKNSGSQPQSPNLAASTMPAMPPEKIELHATGQKTNLLGFVCEQYEIRQHGEVMEIWSTEQLFPFEPYSPNQPMRFGPRQLEQQWGGLLKAKKQFPLLAVLKFENGAELMRFEVQLVEAEKIEDKDGALFQPPPDYHEIEPLPF